MRSLVKFKILGKYLLVSAIMFLFIENTQAQRNQLSIGVQAPLFYTISYEEQVYKNIKINVLFGWQEQPFRGFLIDQAKRKGVAEEISDITHSSLSQGYNLQGTLKYQFKYFYVGGFYSNISLTATKVPYIDLADYYEVDISAITESYYFFLVGDLTLESKLHGAGFLIGNQFLLNKSWHIGVELSFLKILTSNSKLFFKKSGSEVPYINDLIDEELKTYFDKEGNIPSLNFTLTYQFGKSLHGLFSKKQEPLE
ncbi:MAG: hypothetical protein ACJA0Q_002072 [Saprospiraceae bacterium]|jgi:hypothetical protein